MVKRLLNQYRVNVYAFIISVHEIPVGTHCVHIPTRNNTKTLTFLFWLFIRLKFVNMYEDFECIIVNLYYNIVRHDDHCARLLDIEQVKNRQKFLLISFQVFTYLYLLSTLWISIRKYIISVYRTLDNNCNRYSAQRYQTYTFPRLFMKYCEQFLYTGWSI